jgi:hypothetical protein
LLGKFRTILGAYLVSNGLNNFKRLLVLAGKEAWQANHALEELEIVVHL